MKKDLKLSEMKVGEYGVLDNQVVMLRNNGKAGGCKNNLYLAYKGDIREDLSRDGLNIKMLPSIIIDTDEVSI